MNAYRIVHFVPEPISGMRLPIGALVEEDSNLVFVKSPKSWHGSCFKDQASKQLLKVIVKKLQQASLNVDCLPESLGPCAILDQKMVVPPNIKNLQKWVREKVL